MHIDSICKQNKNIYCIEKLNNKKYSVHTLDMKKLLALFFVVVVVCLTKSYRAQFFDLVQIDGGTYSVYDYYCLDGENSIYIGSGYIISADLKDAKIVFGAHPNCVGQSVTYNSEHNDYDKQKAHLQLVEVFSEKVDDIEVVYGYTKLLDKYISLDNQKVNIQYAYRDGVVTIGYPLIAGSY